MLITHYCGQKVIIIHANSPGLSMRLRPGYGTDLPLSCTGHHISRIKSSFELFLCLGLNFSAFLAQNVNFSYLQYGFCGIFARI